MTSTLAVTRRQLIAGAVGALSGAVFVSTAHAAAKRDISHTAASIHDEVIFNATPQRVFDALMDERQFQQVTALSAAVQSGMVPGKKPAAISRAAGGAFALFDGHITGRNIQIIPNKRIVQAWRAGDWPEGVYSIAKFELSANGAGTTLVFDHTGFPAAEAQHLEEGWTGNYWEPLKKYLAT